MKEKNVEADIFRFRYYFNITITVNGHLIF